MGEAREFRLHDSAGFCDSFCKNENEQKITDIFNLLLINYYRDIRLEEVAAFASMNPSAFCRFFKNSVNKTFTHVLNEIRIGMACKKLINTDLHVGEVGYGFGYHDVSYFNRTFRKIKGITPLQYWDKHLFLIPVD
jgi:AraC-like DNA-binding protein